MILVLPIVFLLFFHLQLKKTNCDYFGAFGKALLYLQLTLLIITNLLSIPGILNAISLTVCWVWIAVILVIVIWKYPSKKENNVVSMILQRVKDFSIAEKIMVELMAVLFVILFFAALFTVPYNYDSMTYHLARIGHWIDNQSVNHFVTSIARQNYSPVLAEYNLLHKFLLTGSDSFLNMLQYFAMVVTALYVYKCARMIGTNRSFSIFGAFLFVTMPLTISQSMTTQNDLFGAMWFALFLYYLLQFVQMEKIEFHKNTRNLLFLTALTVAFAFLTKTSICASMIFFLPWLFIVRLLKKDKILELIKSAAFAGVSIVAVISETLIRNVLSAGTIMPDTASGDIMVATKNVYYIIVNILKNYSLILTQHLSDALNGFICRIAIHTGATLKVEVNNVAISFHGFDYVRHMNRGDNMYSHDITPSAFVGYLALICGVILIVLAIRHIKSHAQSVGFGISCWLSFGFIMALLRWQPWGTRIMYPALAMTVIMIANILDLLFGKIKKKGIILIPLALFSLYMAIPSITYNMEPSVTNAKEGMANRLSRYFTFNDRYDSYMEMADELGSLSENQEIDGFLNVGVQISGDGYDYPLWLMFRRKMPQTTLSHIVSADTPLYENSIEPPSYILRIELGALNLGDTLTYKGETYHCIFVSSNGEDGIFQKVKN